MSGKTYEAVEFDFDAPRKKQDFTSLTLWLPATHKRQYDELQLRTNKEFGKFIKQLVTDKITETVAKLPGESEAS